MRLDNNLIACAKEKETESLWAKKEVCEDMEMNNMFLATRIPCNGEIYSPARTLT